MLICLSESPGGPLTKNVESFHHVAVNTHLISCCREQGVSQPHQKKKKKNILLSKHTHFKIQKSQGNNSALCGAFTLTIILSEWLILFVECRIIRICMFHFCSCRKIKDAPTVGSAKQNLSMSHYELELKKCQIVSVSVFQMQELAD